MIAFVLTRKGYDDFVSFAGRLPEGSWVNAGVLSPEEVLKIRATAELSTFTKRVDPDSTSEVSEAIEIVREHNPGVVIWVESSSSTDVS